ncbi:molybdate ABC transporter substrate-binding protein [Kaistia soli]|uniref:molybdate ABC transporter substrate-binding protein n=1 Tax=Kaistia soli TaxID=446684 RepID=UPI003CC80D23
MRLTRRLALALTGLAFVAAPLAALPARAADVTVFAAASLKEALGAATATYKAKTGKPVAVSYAASSALAKQIEAGAPADIFFSADLDWMDELAKKGLIDPSTRTTLLGNTLVLVAPKDSAATITIGKNSPLAAALGADGKLAMGAVASVPAGKYGKASLTALGVWDAVAPHVAEADNVRGALAFVARGEAPFGIVYGTDAKAEPGVKVVGTFPEDSHPPIVYPIALVKASSNPDARAFLDWLVSPEARPAFEQAGFTVIGSQG